jgi:RimJ/RimL family protein N-acetyltransferase
MSEVTLETERLILRMWCEDDLEEYAKMCADPEVMHFLGGKTFSLTESWRHMAFMIGHWQLRGYGHWAIEEKSSGRFLGRLGFLNPAGWPGFELGWMLGKEFWGRGYATEGARRALAYAFTELNKDHVISCIHPDNSPSIRVAERLGEKLEGEAEILGTKVMVYGVDRPAGDEQRLIGSV